MQHNIIIMKKKIIAAAILGFVATAAAVVFAAGSVTTPTCTLTAGPSLILLGAQTPVTATWTTSGATSVGVTYQYTGANGPVTVYSTSTPNGTVTAPILGSLTNWVTVTAVNGQGAVTCKATIFGYSNHQPN